MNFDSTNGLNYDNIFYQSCYSNKIENFENILNNTNFLDKFQLSSILNR